MQFDYFYGSQAEQFSFYRIPKVLFTDPQFSSRCPLMQRSCTVSCWTA